MNAVAERDKPRDGAIDRRGLGREPRGRVKTELPTAIGHAIRLSE